jgi:hypothetical protein
LSRSIVVCLALAAALAFAAPASAATLYAGPLGTAPIGSGCLELSPCNFKTAAEGAASGDEVIVLPGVHEVGNQPIGIYNDVNIHGVAPNWLTTIRTSAGSGIELNASSVRLADLSVEHTVGTAMAIALGYGTLERVHVSSSDAQDTVHVWRGNIRDSMIINTRVGGVAMASDAGYDFNVNVGGSTLIGAGADSTGLLLQVGVAFGGDATIEDTIIDGGGTNDIYASAGEMSDITATITNSNFATVATAGTVSVNAPDSNNNQSTPPVYLDAPAGDYHQAPSSPTIDAGTVESASGRFDVDNDPRVIGSKIDIGADEYEPVNSVIGSIISPVGGTTANASPPLAGSGRIGLPVKIYDGATQIAGATGDVAGNWSATLATPLADGLHQLTVSTVSRSGVESAKSAPVAVTVDTTVPRTPIFDTTAPTTRVLKKPQAKTRQRKAVFRFGSNEQGVCFECKLDRGKYRRCPARFSKKVSRGKHTLWVRAVDAAGNRDETPAKVRWRVL